MDWPWAVMVESQMGRELGRRVWWSQRPPTHAHLPSERMRFLQTSYPKPSLPASTSNITKTPLSRGVGVSSEGWRDLPTLWESLFKNSMALKTGSVPQRWKERGSWLVGNGGIWCTKQNRIQKKPPVPAGYPLCCYCSLAGQRHNKQATPSSSSKPRGGGAPEAASLWL